MTAIVLRGDARDLPLPDESVDLIVTSPPYFGLRSYEDGGEHYEGQIGSEATPQEWVAAMLDCTREWMRVLKPSGSMFVNLGDSYYSGKGAPGRTTTDPKNAGRNARRTTRSPLDYGLDMPRKTLLGTPWRYAIGCTDELGLILRRDIIWHKPNPLPESTGDRCATRHEYLFHLVKQPRYFSAIDEVREPHTGGTHGRRADGKMSPKEAATVANGHRRGYFPEDTENPLGKLPGSVWEIASQPLSIPPRVAHAHCCQGLNPQCKRGLDHYAAFPMELPRRCILGWSPPGICMECGEGRRPVAVVANIADRKGRKQRIVDLALDGAHGPDGRGGERWKQTVRITGYACACTTAYSGDIHAAPPTMPAVVVDPFGGTGTTALVADVLGRLGITFDRSADYCRLATWRTTDPGERAKAMQVPKPPPVPDGQEPLFDLAAS